MDLHKAIRAIHNSAVSINGDTEKTIVAKDKDGKLVTIDWTKVKAWKDPNEYQYKRADEYPSIVDQLDDIYHNGIDGWKKTIKAVKDKYPKE
tara:strand:+ start:1149 stop:1424 length:276 start_codon:yes stop_codon:yes gene_type:complete